jgi:hypothetical protein
MARLDALAKLAADGEPGVPNGRSPTKLERDEGARRTAPKDRPEGGRRRDGQAEARAAQGDRTRPLSSTSAGGPFSSLAAAGDHRAATLDDVVVLCLSCHGTLDAPRDSSIF